VSRVIRRILASRADDVFSGSAGGEGVEQAVRNSNKKGRVPLRPGLTQSHLGQQIKVAFSSDKLQSAGCSK